MQLAASFHWVRSHQPPLDGGRLRRTLASILAGIVLMTAGCGSDRPTDESTMTAPRDPAEVVAVLFDHLAAGDYAATAPLVDEAQIAILTAIEGAEASEVATMLERGLPDQVRADFWEGFVASLPLLVDASVDRAEVGAAKDIGSGFFAVPVTLPGAERPARWIVRADADRARLDLLATFGPAFAPNLVAWLQRIPEGPDREAIRLALLDSTDSLQVGLEQEPLGPWGEAARTGVAELEAALAG